MNPSVAGIIAFIIPAIPGLITVAQIMIKGGPNRMDAVLNALRTMMTRADSHPSAPNTPPTQLLTDDQLRIVIETVLADQKRTGALNQAISSVGDSVTTLAAHTVTVPISVPIISVVEVKK